MRYSDIFEGVNQYMAMYEGIPQLNKSDVTNFVKEAEQNFKRKDRVTWLCRWHRIWLLAGMEKVLKKRGETFDTEKVWRRYLSSINSTITRKEAEHWADEVILSVTQLKHFLDLPIPGIKDVIWERQSLSDLLNTFTEEEQEWRDNLKANRAVRIQEEDEILIDFHNGWAWWNLNRGGCSEEGNAMGHCGNGAGRGYETILSLRKRIDDEHATPHLTFILDGKSLGEMKGRNNEKPHPKYHDMIKALLLSDYVDEIKGGGYLPQNNFSIDDLAPEEKEELVEKKPGLKRAWELWREYEKAKDDKIDLSPEFMSVLRDKVEGELSSYNIREIDWEKEYVIIDKSSLDQYLSYRSTPSHHLDELFDDLDELIESYAEAKEDRADSVNIAIIVKSKYEYLLGEMIQYENSYVIYNVYDILEDGHVYTKIGIRDFLYEDDEIISSVSELNDEHEYDNGYDWVENLTTNDAISHELVQYTVAKASQKPTNDYSLVKVILDEYGDRAARAQAINGSGSRFYTPTSTDPNQLSFDFPKD